MKNKTLTAFAAVVLALYVPVAGQDDASSGPVERQGGKLVSVSGVSSGAYMAVQLQVAFSETFMGVGAIAGGPYYCAEDMTDITAIKLKCMAGAGIIPADYGPYRDKAIELAKDGQIDPVSNLGDTKVFIFNSIEDQVINPGLGYLSVLFFQHFSQDAGDNVVALNAIPGYLDYAVAHGLPTAMTSFDAYLDEADRGFPCAPANSQQYPWFPDQLYRGNDPWIYHCPYPNEYAPQIEGYSLVKSMLDHIYGGIADPVEPKGVISSLDQLGFVDDPEIKTVDDLKAHGIGEKMYTYTPSACKDDPSNCDKVHVALHGCQQFPEWSFVGKAGSDKAGQTITFGDLFYNGAYNGLAEANNIIVVYPQAHSIGTAQDDVNPYGCWEFWAFRDDDKDNYYTQAGVEMRMIKNMVDHFTAAPRKQ